ncbi:unnamed protein product [Chondrus crispus]|uniref:CUE domain-containing protein n=1 Tax=Chondrus crispus TaxID=2769 RepID=R7QFX6_CHOCR|nr:unnamed protein product [Chondrus crispus]CDF36325.1 unnamed protein product [Chondrus crispus]|eukprot:XP_005716144.1 unnamed protein product [Chondrus crispus]
MFPDADVATLQAALAANDGSVERTVDSLLSTHSSSPRSRQVEQDAALARSLQAEQTLPSQPAADPPHHQPRAPDAFELPSLADLQNAVKPLVDGVAYAGRVAADGVSALYRDFVAPDVPTASHHSPAHYSARRAQDDTVVLRGEATSSPAARSTRLRRASHPASSVSSADKKDS